MFGGESALRLYFDAVAFAGQREQAWAGELAALRSRGAFISTGVSGAVERVLGHRSEDVMASVYAEAAGRLGWLTVDSTGPEAAYDSIRDRLPAWCARDRGYDEVIAEFGPPSVLIGGSSPRYPKTFAYAPASPGASPGARADTSAGTGSDADGGRPLVFFHLWNGRRPGAGASWPPEHPEPVLLAARCGGADFASGFTFTPLGADLRARLTS